MKSVAPMQKVLKDFSEVYCIILSRLALKSKGSVDDEEIFFTRLAITQGRTTCRLCDNYDNHGDIFNRDSYERPVDVPSDVESD